MMNALRLTMESPKFGGNSLDWKRQKLFVKQTQLVDTNVLCSSIVEIEDTHEAVRQYFFNNDPVIPIGLVIGSQELSF